MGGALAVLLLLRLSLGTLISAMVNHQLAKMSAYEGHIDGIGLRLWQGAYQIRGLSIEKKAGKVPIPFVTAPLIDIGLQWAALLRWRLVATVGFEGGSLNFVHGPDEDRGQNGEGEDWILVLNSLVPLKIDRLRLKDCDIHYSDPYGSPPVAVHLERLNLLAEDLSSRQDGRPGALSSVSASAQVTGKARLDFRSRFDPFARPPTFDYGATLRGLQLGDWDPIFQRYLGIDVQSGTLDAYSEAATAEGKYQGYVKPIIHGLKVMRPHEPLQPLKLAKKALIGVLAWIFENKQGELATQFDISGAYKDPKIDGWGAVRYLFENAFSKALPSTLEGAPQLKDLHGRPG